MTYGTVKVDNITFTNGGIDQTVTVSGIVQSISGSITATGTIQGATIIGTSTVSGATVTGDAGVFTTVTGGSAGFTTVTGTTVTGTTADFVSGVFTTQISGATVTGDIGSFTTLTGGVATITSGVFALGAANLPSISFSGDPNTGIYSPGADQLALSTSGTPRVQFGTSEVVFNDDGNNYDFRIEGDAISSLFFVDASADAVGIGTSTPSYLIDASNSSAPTLRLTDSIRHLLVRGGSTTQNPGIGTDYAGDLSFFTNGAANERARIDSSGRLLVGTASSPSAGLGQYARIVAQGYTGGATGEGIVTIARGKLATAMVNTDTVGQISFTDSAGNDFAKIFSFVDGTPGSGDYPGALAFSTTADEAASPTERFRITNDGVRGYNQSAPAAVDTTATLTVANLKTGIITSSTAAAVTMTLPTGTLTEGGFAVNSLYNNFTFEWTVINTGGANAVTVQGDTGHTLVGSGTVAAGVSGRFASRRTAANTFVTYRLS